VLFDAKDKIETDDPDLQEIFTQYVTRSLSKKLAAEYKRPWTDKLETELQESIAALVGAVKAKGLASIKIYSVKPDGRRIPIELSVEKIAADRVLQ
jgi:hypothetical protein